MRTAEGELDAQPEFGHVVVNDRLEDATDELVTIVRTALGSGARPLT
jgi:guanylate kinase